MQLQDLIVIITIKITKFYKNLNLLNISPKHKILSKHIIQMDEIISDFEINKDIFFKKNIY